MEEILIIANEFPPKGGSGVQRSVNLVSRLPGLGYRPVVITRKFSEGLRDDSLLSKLPKNLIRYDLPAFDFVNKKGFLGKILRYFATRFLVPDAEVFWYLKHRKKVLSILDDRGIKKIYSTSYPYSDHLMAKYLKSCRSEIIWMADFRDEWTNNPYFEEKWYMKLRAKKEKVMEKAVVSQCDHLNANTPFMLENFLKDYPFKKSSSSCIPNGYDEFDFMNYELSNSNNNKFLISYMGALYGKRHPNFFLEAVQSLIKEKLIPEDEIELNFIGNYHSHVIEQLKANYGLQNSMKLIPYMPHNELLAHISHSSLLLLIEPERNFFTGKIFEYIAMRIPILATVAIDGAAANLIRETKTGDVVGFKDIGGIKGLLLSRYRDWRDGRVNYSPNYEAIKKYGWNEHSKSIISIFEMRGV